MSFMDRLRDFNLRDGKFREAINNNQNIAVVVCVVVIAVAVGYIVMMSGGGAVRSVSNQAWYYDTVTKTYFKDKATLIPPITSPDGNPAVLAYLFTCTGDCSEDGWYAAYYEKFTDEVKQQIETQGYDELGIEAFEMGRLVSLDGETWMTQMEIDQVEEFHQRSVCPDGSIPEFCPAK